MRLRTYGKRGSGIAVLAIISFLVLGTPLAAEASNLSIKQQMKAAQVARDHWNMEEAERLWRPLAERGYPEAQFGLAEIIAKAWLPDSYPEAAAVTLYRKAAAQGYAQAEFALAGMYRQGKGVAQNTPEALRLFRRAAAQRNTNAQEALGAIYDEGTIAPKNVIRATHWYRKAAMLGSDMAQCALGRRYLEGNGVARSLTKSLHWLRKALKQQNTCQRGELQQIFEKHHRIWPGTLFPMALSPLKYDGRPITLDIAGQRTRFTPVRFDIGHQGVSPNVTYCGLIIKEPGRARQGVSTSGAYHNVPELNACEKLNAIGAMPALNGAPRIGLSYENSNDNEWPQRGYIVLIRDKQTAHWRIDRDASDDVDMESRGEIETLDDMRKFLSRSTAPTPASPAE